MAPTISDRLSQKLEATGESTRSFQQKVQAAAEEGTRGVSYASVYEYVNGQTDPPLSFLRVAAEVLGVKLAWLVTGEGPETPAAPAEESHWDLFEDWMGQVFPPYLAASHHAREGLALLWWERVERVAQLEEISAAREGDTTESTSAAELGRGEVGEHLARQLGEALITPLEAMGCSSQNLDQTLTRDAYIQALTQAVSVIAYTQSFSETLRRVGQKLQERKAGADSAVTAAKEESR